MASSSSPQMQQCYRDDVEHVSVGAHAPLLLPTSLPTQPRWAQEGKHVDRSSHRRKFTLTLGALAVAYLVYCGWVAYSQHETYVHHHYQSSSDVAFPWPHPPRRPHPPPSAPPAISVLGCVPIPSLDTDAVVSEKVKLSVSYPANASVILPNRLLFGNVAVEKASDEDESEMGEEESTLKVAIKVTSRPPFPGPPSDANEEEEEKFLLCATTVVARPPPEHKPHQWDTEGEHPALPPLHPHRPPHPPPVVVDILPALNETYPKLPPPPPPPPHHHPGKHHHHHGHFKAKLSATWHTAISFLFPMFAELPKVHPRPPKGHPCPPHLALPPFIVSEVAAIVPKTSHVIYGSPPPPPFFLTPFPHPHPPHPPAH